MNSKSSIKVIVFVICFLALCMVTFLNAKTCHCEEQTSDVVKEPADILITYSNDTLKDFSFYYKDEYLIKNIGSSSPSGELQLASAALACVAYNQATINSVLAKMGYTQLYQNNYDDSLNRYDNNDFVGYTIADKYIRYNNEVYRIIIIPIRGTWKSEWYSDFRIGEGPNHYGFYTAADEVLNALSHTVGGYDASHTLIWMMGHSRGAAVSNIVAGTISTDASWSSSVIRDNVFSYNIACPSVTMNPVEPLHNIFNYNNPGDGVPCLPLASWGYNRYGIDINLPASDYDNVARRYKEVNNADYKVGMNNVAFTDLLHDIAPTQEDLLNNDIVKLALDCAAWALVEMAKANTCSLFDVIADHPCAGVQIVGGYLYSTSFPSEVLLALSANMSVADVQLLLDTSLRDYTQLETALTEAIQETSKMSDVDSEDEEQHRKYLEWQTWIKNNTTLISATKNMTNIDITSIADLERAHTASKDRHKDYLGIVSAIQDAFLLFFDKQGNIGAAFTQAHPSETYVLWMNSMYYGCQGWSGNSDITTVNWRGRAQKSYVGEGCFQNCTNLKSITDTPDGIMVLMKAFYDCDALKDIVFSQEGMSIWPNAFTNCDGIKTISIPDSTKDIEIRNSAFSGCTNLNLIEIEGYPVLGGSAFSGCSGVKTIQLPIDYEYYNYGSPFSGCRFETIIYTPGKTGIQADYTFSSSGRIEVNAIKSLKKIVYSEGITRLGDYATYVYDSNFYQSDYQPYLQLEEVVLPSTLESIGDSALRAVAGTVTGTLENVTQIERYAFTGCTGLKMTSLPPKLKDIEPYAFSSFYGLEGKIEIHDGTKIGNGAFDDCKNITELVLPDNCEVGERAFSNCKGIQKVTMPIDLEYGVNAFSSDSAISEVVYTPGKTGIQADHTYSSSSRIEVNAINSLKKIVYSEGIKRLGTYAAYAITGSAQLKLEEVVLPSTLESIGNSALYSLTSVSTLTTTEKLTTIGSNNFKNCPNLTVHGIPGSYADEYCENNNVPFSPGVTAISLAKSSITLPINGIHQAIAVSYTADEDVSYGIIKWSSDHPDIVTIDSNTGKITALQEGSAVITAKLKKLVATCTVLVSDNIILTDEQKPVVSSGLIYSGGSHPLITAPTEALPVGFTVKYSIDAGSTWSTEAPTEVNAGEYTINVLYSGDTTEFEIEPLLVSISPKMVTVTGIAVNDKVYDGNTTATLDCSKVVFEEKIEGDELSLTGDAEFADANVGESKDVAISNLALGGASASNYSLSATTASCKGKITAKPITDATVELVNDTFTYTGTVQYVAVDQVLLDGNSLAANTDWEITSGDSGTDSKTYTLIITGKGNYEDTAAAEWRIDQATPVITHIPTASPIIYGQSLASSTLDDGEAKLENVDIAGTFNWDNPSIKPVVSDSELTEYDVLFVPTDSENLTPITCKVKVVVNRADPTLAALSANNRIYDGSEKPLITVTDDAVGGVLWFALGENTITAPEFDGLSESADKKWSTSIISATDANTYNVWYFIKGDENHNDTEAAVVTVLIQSPNPSMVTPPTGNELVYNGTEQQAFIGGTVENGKILYAISTDPNVKPRDEDYSETIPTVEDAGTYYVFYKIVEE